MLSFVYGFNRCPPTNRRGIGESIIGLTLGCKDGPLRDSVSVALAELHGQSSIEAVRSN